MIGFSVDGVFTALAVTDRITAAPPAFGVALAHVWPSQVGGQSPDVAERAVAALGIANGPSYTQLRIGAGRPAGDRGGGPARRRSRRRARPRGGRRRPERPGDRRGPRGTAHGRPSPSPQAGGAVTRFLVAPAGILERVEVPDGVQARIYREPGFVFAPLRRGSDRAGAVLVTGESRAEAVARAEAAAERIRFFTADAGALLQAN